MAVFEARRSGQNHFSVAVDREGRAYMPYLFGPAAYCVTRKPEELPRRVTQHYIQLTAG